MRRDRAGQAASERDQGGLGPTILGWVNKRRTWSEFGLVAASLILASYECELSRVALPELHGLSVFPGVIHLPAVWCEQSGLRA